MGHPELPVVTHGRVVTVSPQDTTEDAITAVMEFTPTDDGVSVYYVYVTDNGDLVGVVSMRELLNAENSKPVSETMTTDVITVESSSTLQTAMQQIINSGFAVLPVVDDDSAFVGVIRASDVIDTLDEQTTKQMFKQAGFWMK